ncbi:CPBP family intramembrane glutamic endopeptidase [Halalkalibacter krulwichiae]|nr:CPBP family intramembrane glutamic endopeptidase [Halalkalibacter krulwichiae]
MKKNTDFYLSLLIAFLLLFSSFSWQPIDFWVLFPLSLLLLIGWSFIFEQHELKRPTFSHFIYAVGSGIFLYGLFAIGKWLLTFLNLPLLDELESLYNVVQPTEPLHFLWLFLIIIPGEEWFWRGYVVKRLMKHVSNIQATILGTLLYAAAHLVTGSILLVLAALFAGLAWSFLYTQTRNIWLPILSHLVFNLFLLILFPLL